MNGHRYGSTPRVRVETVPPIDVPMIDGELRGELTRRMGQARDALNRMTAAAAWDSDAYYEAAEMLGLLLDAMAYRLTVEPRRRTAESARRESEDLEDLPF